MQRVHLTHMKSHSFKSKTETLADKNSWNKITKTAFSKPPPVQSEQQQRERRSKLWAGETGLTFSIWELLADSSETWNPAAFPVDFLVNHAPALSKGRYHGFPTLLQRMRGSCPPAASQLPHLGAGWHWCCAIPLGRTHKRGSQDNRATMIQKARHFVTPPSHNYQVVHTQWALEPRPPELRCVFHSSPKPNIQDTQHTKQLWHGDATHWKSSNPSLPACPGSNKTMLPLQTPSKHITYADNHPIKHYKRQFWTTQSKSHGHHHKLTLNTLALEMRSPKQAVGLLEERH